MKNLKGSAAAYNVTHERTTLVSLCMGIVCMRQVRVHGRCGV